MPTLLDGPQGINLDAFPTRYQLLCSLLGEGDDSQLRYFANELIPAILANRAKVKASKPSWPILTAHERRHSKPDKRALMAQGPPISPIVELGKGPLYRTDDCGK